VNERSALKEFILLLSILILIASSVYAATVPKGANAIEVSDSGRNTLSNDSYIIQAWAGNVTALVITDIRITEAWQGYYGNVTGTITLDDGDNQTMYDWDLPDPTGEIYASNGTNVNWGKIYCMNVSGFSTNNTYNGITYSTNGSDIELNFGINATDKDGLNETFNDTFDSSFQVGSITIDSTDGCSEAHPFVDENHNAVWDEVLLSDNTSLIFTSIIRQSQDAFKTGNEPADFQLMVLENGHAGSETQVTDYYFYVELT
jgi:hypothetical protein